MIKKMLVFLIWIFTAVACLGTSIFYLNFYSQAKKAYLRQQLNQSQPQSYRLSYQMYASLPQTLGAFTSQIETKDAIPELVYQYLEKYKSPMTNTATAFVDIFRSYGIDPIIPLAIAQCESNLGKKIPDDSYNPFGLGIHSAGTLKFMSWEEGYEKMAKILKENYVEKGYLTVEEVMTKYCPQSLDNGGSWAKCVNKFSSDIETLTIND